MTAQRMDHVGIVASDVAAATESFVELGLELQGEMTLEGRSVDRIVAASWASTESGQRSRSCRPRTATDDSS